MVPGAGLSGPAKALSPCKRAVPSPRVTDVPGGGRAGTPADAADAATSQRTTSHQRAADLPARPDTAATHHHAADATTHDGARHDSAGHDCDHAGGGIRLGL